MCWQVDAWGVLLQGSNIEPEAASMRHTGPFCPRSTQPNLGRPSGRFPQGGLCKASLEHPLVMLCLERSSIGWTGRTFARARDLARAGEGSFATARVFLESSYGQQNTPSPPPPCTAIPVSTVQFGGAPTQAVARLGRFCAAHAEFSNGRFTQTPVNT
jgi:hypothetical protein